MDKYFAVAIGIIVIVAAIALILQKKSKKSNGTQDNSFALTSPEGSRIARKSIPSMDVQFESISALTEEEQAALVEIKDPKLLARIDNVIPNAFQAAANVGAVNQYHNAVKSAGQLYQAIIPQGAVLSKSKATEGAVRGFFHGPDGIRGHADLMAVDSNMGSSLATLGAANAVFGVASLVVGQYYMTQINSQLNEITDEISKISGFQVKEFQGKIGALIAQVQKFSRFQFDIMENEEERKNTLNQLPSLERECDALLVQANLTLKEFEKKRMTDYASYEKDVAEAQSWYQYQQILLEIMLCIEDLTYSLNLGQISPEQCYSVLISHAEQSNEALRALEEWHKKAGLAFEIDLSESRRRRQGLGSLFANIPALFNEDYHYKRMAKRTTSMISKQSSGNHLSIHQGTLDLFTKDVRLIAKDGKMYYLPDAKAVQ